ncbi:hypothetical protein HY995_00810 [Candidatus Micrarchaeota archaeon]|nr:hypothetical protein [Candidatus Micrarchaeota archaeon]MBI5176608.1 hypothetical protein [Candidatus Micrarchaeota archaeon]
MPGRKVAVEFDGAFFHDSPKQKKRYALKDKLLAAKGWRVIRVRDDGLSFKELEGEGAGVRGALVGCNWVTGWRGDPNAR